MTDITATPVVGWRRLDYLPIALFGSVMGLTGLSAAWRLAQAPSAAHSPGPGSSQRSRPGSVG